jgi:hypothetical protein
MLNFLQILHRMNHFIGFYSVFRLKELLPPFHNVRLSSIIHIHIDVNESRHTYIFRFINIYMNMSNARKSYILKRRKYKL